MKFDVIVNAPIAPRTFPVTAVIGGVPCIKVSTMDTNHLPSETIKVFGEVGGATKEHNTPDGPVQEVHVGDFIGVYSKCSMNAPSTLNSLYITAIQGNLIVTTNAIL
jgi:hypothetical protein